MKVGDPFTHITSRGIEVHCRVGTMDELVGFLARGGPLEAFEIDGGGYEAFQLVGFIRGTEGIAMTARAVRESREELERVLGMPMDIPGSRRRIAREYSTPVPTPLKSELDPRLRTSTMDIGEQFTLSVGTEEEGVRVHCRVVKAEEVLPFLKQGGLISAFDSPAFRVFGFRRGAEAVVMTTQEFRANLSWLEGLLDMAMNTLVARQEVARAFSTEVPLPGVTGGSLRLGRGRSGASWQTLRYAEGLSRSCVEPEGSSKEQFTWLTEDGVEVRCRVVSVGDLLAFLKQGGLISSFDGKLPQRRWLGFRRGTEGVVVTLQELKENREGLVTLRWVENGLEASLAGFPLRDPEDRQEVARAFSTVPFKELPVPEGPGWKNPGSAPRCKHDEEAPKGGLYLDDGFGCPICGATREEGRVSEGPKNERGDGRSTRDELLDLLHGARKLLEDCRPHALIPSPWDVPGFAVRVRETVKAIDRVFESEQTGPGDAPDGKLTSPTGWVPLPKVSGAYLHVKVEEGMFAGERTVFFSSEGKTYSLIVDEVDLEGEQLRVVVLDEVRDHFVIRLPRETVSSARTIRVPRSLIHIFEGMESVDPEIRRVIEENLKDLYA